MTRKATIPFTSRLWVVWFTIRHNQMFIWNDPLFAAWVIARYLFFRIVPGFMVLALALGIVGCATKRPVHPDPSIGHIGRTEWPDCRINAAAGTVDCRCSKFVMDLKKDGTTVMRCAEVQ